VPQGRHRLAARVRGLTTASTSSHRSLHCCRQRPRQRRDARAQLSVRPLPLLVRHWLARERQCAMRLCPSSTSTSSTFKPVPSACSRLVVGDGVGRAVRLRRRACVRLLCHGSTAKVRPLLRPRRRTARLQARATRVWLLRCTPAAVRRVCAAPAAVCGRGEHAHLYPRHFRRLTLTG
jgi:hypothetical protein